MNTTTSTGIFSFRILLIAAALSLLPMLNLYYIGEEAIFPITAMEMWQHGSWLKQSLYGLDTQHNPLFNWLIIAFANLFGWTHVLEVARGLTIAATLGSAAVLAWLVSRLYQERSLAAFSALIYLTFSDVMTYHGWLAYVDPLFAFFIFAAIATLWVACTEQRASLLWVTAIALSCALLSKAFTVYIFYAAAWLVLARTSVNRKLLLSPVSLAAHAAMLIAPLIWFALIPAGPSQGGRMFDEILYKLNFPGIGEYLAKLLLYPLEIWAQLLPAAALVIYFAVRGRIRQDDAQPQHFRTAVLIAGLNFLPYWLSPHSGVRYLLPVYPLFALIVASLIWRAGHDALRTAKKWIIAAIAFNFLLGLVLFPYYQKHYRGENYALTATDIVALSRGYDLYCSDVSASGLNVAAYINQQRYPHQTLQYPPEILESGFIVSRTADPAIGQVHRKYQLLGDEMYLLCRGAACDSGLPLK